MALPFLAEDRVNCWPEGGEQRRRVFVRVGAHRLRPEFVIERRAGLHGLRLACRNAPDSEPDPVPRSGSIANTCPSSSSKVSSDGSRSTN